MFQYIIRYIDDAYIQYFQLIHISILILQYVYSE